MIVIIDHDEISQLQMPRKTGSFAGDTFHRTTISKETIRVVIDNFIVRFIVYSAAMCLRDSQSHGISEPLTERARCNFDALCVMRFWVPRGYAVDGLIGIIMLMKIPEPGRHQATHAESFDIIKRQFVAKQMQQCILQHTSMTVSETNLLSASNIWKIAANLRTSVHPS